MYKIWCLEGSMHVIQSCTQQMLGVSIDIQATSACRRRQMPLSCWVAQAAHPHRDAQKVHASVQQPSTGSMVRQGAMTQQPAVFSNHYYNELLAGGGAFPSDRSLLSDPATAQWVRSCRVCAVFCTWQQHVLCDDDAY